MIGEKEPLENEEITSGLCDRCFEKEMADIREFQRRRAAERAHGEEGSAAEYAIVAAGIAAAIVLAASLLGPALASLFGKILWPTF